MNSSQQIDGVKKDAPISFRHGSNKHPFLSFYVSGRREGLGQLFSFTLPRQSLAILFPRGTKVFFLPSICRPFRRIQMFSISKSRNLIQTIKLWGSKLFQLVSNPRGNGDNPADFQFHPSSQVCRRHWGTYKISWYDQFGGFCLSCVTVVQCVTKLLVNNSRVANSGR